MTAAYEPDNPLHGKHFNVKYYVRHASTGMGGMFSLCFDARYFRTPFDQAKASIENKFLMTGAQLCGLHVRLTANPLSNMIPLMGIIQAK